MFVSIIFNTEYMDYESRKVWYLKNLFHCSKNRWPLITHEYLKIHFEEIRKNVEQRFYQEFEMAPLDAGDLAEVKQYFVPDAIFESIQKRLDSRTEMLTYLYKETDPDLQASLKEILNSIIQNAGGMEIKGILHCLNAFKTLKDLSQTYRIPIISYVFSAIRKVHGYRETLYCANVSDGGLLFGSMPTPLYLIHWRKIHAPGIGSARTHRAIREAANFPVDTIDGCRTHERGLHL